MQELVKDANPALDEAIRKFGNLVAPAFRASSPLTEQQVYEWLRDVLPKDGAVLNPIEAHITQLVRWINSAAREQ